MAYEHLGMEREYWGIAGLKDGNGKVTYAHRDGPAGERFATKQAAKQAYLQHRHRQAALAGDHYGCIAAQAALTIDAEERSAAAQAAVAPKPRASTGLPSYNKTDVNKVALEARAEERARVRAVFASEHSKGRERLCATLLGAPDGWTAQQIVAALPSMGDDRAFAAKVAAPANAKADAIWERARDGQASAPAPATSSAADGVWDRARAAVDAPRSAGQ